MADKIKNTGSAKKKVQPAKKKTHKKTSTKKIPASGTAKINPGKKGKTVPAGKGKKSAAKNKSMTPPKSTGKSEEIKEITVRGKTQPEAVPESSTLPAAKTKKTDAVKTLAKELENAASDNLPAEIEDVIDPEALHRGDTPMSLVDHLEEFRSRILVILGTLIVLTAVGISFSDYLIEFINRPFIPTHQKLHVFKLLGGFMIRLKASAVVALLLTVPLIFYHAWKFIVPAINKEDRMFSRLTLLAAILLFYGGMAFVFFGLIPFVLQILIQFIPSDMLSTIGADDYLSFILLFSIAMGFLFELPIAVLILTRMGLLTPQFLIAKRKIAIVLCFLIGGIITPQDPFSMFFVAIPLWFLYEVSIFVSRFVLVRKKKRELRNQN